MSLIREIKESPRLKFGEGIVSLHFLTHGKFRPHKGPRETGFINQDNYLYWLSLAPENRIARVTQLICKIFTEEIKKPQASNRI